MIYLQASRLSSSLWGICFHYKPDGIYFHLVARPAQENGIAQIRLHQWMHLRRFLI